MSALVSEDVMAALVALHAPVMEEVECWADEENGPEVHAERFPECPGNDDPHRCDGHSYQFRTCSECGQVGAPDEVMFRPWPCATLVAVGFDPAEYSASTSERDA